MTTDGWLIHEGLRFRDLDHDGVLAPYEDWRLPVETRVEDLLTRIDAAADGFVPIERIEQPASRVLAQKFELGLFDDPWPPPD